MKQAASMVMQEARRLYTGQQLIRRRAQVEKELLELKSEVALEAERDAQSSRQRAYLRNAGVMPRTSRIISRRIRESSRVKRGEAELSRAVHELSRFRRGAKPSSRSRRY